MKKETKERDLFIKLCRYCAYRERSVSEVFTKMTSLEIEPKLQQDLIVLLKQEKFLDERRFARSYAGGKFRNNAWGKYKIRNGLKEKKIKSTDIEYGLLTIEEEEYQQKIKEIIDKKNKVYRTGNFMVKRKKIADYLIRKGFETHLVWEILKTELPN